MKRIFFLVILLSIIISAQVDSVKIKQLDSTLATMSRTILDASNALKLKNDYKKLLDEEINDLTVFLNRQYGYYTAKKEEREKLNSKEKIK